MNIPKPFTKREQKKIQKKHSGTSVNNLTKEKSCVDMEELMQFEAARQRALAQKPPKINEKSLTDFFANRIFVNQVDTFNGSHLVEHLSNMTKGFEGEVEGENKSELEKLPEVLAEEEEEFPEIEEESVTTSVNEPKLSPTYEIIGTLEFYSNPKYSRPEDISELLDNEKKCEFLEKIFTCGFIIYDITSDLQCHPKQVEEAKWVLESLVNCMEMMENKLPKTFSKLKDCRLFILISTLLTWTKTKPIDPDFPSLPFTERDYRKRKPHPNYKIHCELEKRVIELGKKYPNHLKTIVIGSGIPYGYEEDIFHFLFRMAWEDAPFLPIFSPGNNIIPVIHINFLASVIENIIKNFPPKQRYIIAMDPYSVKMKDVVKVLAKTLGNGKTKMVDKEEAFLYPEIKQRNYDMLTNNVNLTPGYIMDNITRLDTGLPFLENISQLIAEFKMARGLQPVKIFIHGPPGSGKTFLAKRLSNYYDIPHLHEKGVVEETLNTLKGKIEAIIKKEELEKEKADQEKIEIEGDEASEDGEEEPEEEESLETLKQTLRELEENIEDNGGKLDEEHVLRIFKEKLSSSSCQNKGYVIDGYPETMEQTKTLYAFDGEEEATDGEEESQGGDVSRLCNMSIMPAYVESLDASDEFLIQRLIRLPNINMTEFEEHQMCRRLTEFRALNREDNTPLIFYDEMDVHPMIYNVENDSDPNMEPTFQAIINHVGPPRNYGKAFAPMDDILLQKQEQCRNEQLKDLKAQSEEVRKVAEERRQNIEKWMLLKNQELEMEEKALLVMGMPLRHYLMKYIFPCLTRGLVEVARLRPEDPVDFLSEFLFRENPEGKMFQPDYDKKEQQFADAMKEYEHMLEERQSRTSKTTKKSFSSERSAMSRAVSGVTNYKCSLVSTPVSKYSSKSSSSKKKTDSLGICSCQKSPSLSTCSSDRTPSTPVSCTCRTPDSCEPCDSSDDDEEEEEDPCKCSCK